MNTTIEIVKVKKKEITCIEVANSQDCILGGIHLKLYNWMREEDQQGFFSKIFNEETKLTLGDLAVVLGGRNEWDRIMAAKQFILTLWSAHPTLGPLPFSETLFNLQQKGFFYEEYRDHLRHSLLVFLFGLWVYDRNNNIRNLINQSITGPSKDPSSAFFIRWLIASAYHDICYIFEDKKGDQAFKAQADSYWKNLSIEINEIIETPLSHLKFGGKQLIKREIERKIIDSQGINITRINAIEDLDGIGILSLPSNEKVDLLYQFSSCAIKCGLANNPEKDKTVFLREFYKLANEKNVGDRPTYRDHGIASSALLLQVWEVFIEYCKILRDSDNDGISPILKDELKRIIAEGAQMREHIYSAATAIAFHNLEHAKFTDEYATDLYKRNLASTNSFEIPNNADTALIFLFKLVDCLQNWDRPVFRERKASDLIDFLIDSDVTATIKNNKLNVGYAKNHDELVDKIQAEISVLKQEDLRTLLEFDKNIFDYEEEESASMSETDQEAANSNPFPNFSAEYSNLRTTERIETLVGRIDASPGPVERYKLHCCKVNEQSKILCPLTIETYKIIANLLRSIGAAQETKEFMRHMDEAASHAEKLSEALYTSRDSMKVRCHATNLRTVCRGIIDFFLNLDRVYPEGDLVQKDIDEYRNLQDATEKESLLKAIFDVRLRGYLTNRLFYVRDREIRIGNAFKSIWELSRISLVDDNMSLDSALESGYDKYISFIRDDWHKYLKKSFEEVLRQRTEELVGRLSQIKTKNAFQERKFSNWTNGDRINYPHIESSGFPIWKYR